MSHRLYCVSLSLGEEPVNSRRLFPLCFLLIVTSAVARTPAEQVDSIADDLYELRLKQNPEFAYFLGLPVERHDALSDNSLETLAVYRQEEDRLLSSIKTIDGAALRGTPQWITWGIVLEDLESSIGLRVCAQELWGVNQMGGWQLGFPQIADLQPVGTDELRAQALTRWGKLPGFVRNEIDNLRLGLERGYSSPQSVVRLVIGQMNNLSEVPLDDSPFLSPARRDDDDQFAEDFQALVTGEILPTLTEYRDFLQEEYLPAAREELSVTANPDGLDCYKASLRSYTTLNRSPEEVYALGKKTVEANRARVVELGEELYGVDDFAEIIAGVRADPDNRFSSKEDVLEFSREAVARSKRSMPEWFGRVPTRDVFVEPYPEFQDGTGVSSRYEPPRVDAPGTYRITLYEPTEQRKGGAEITAVHEAWPGHHLQIAIAQELDNLHPMTRFAFNSGFVEGWARYSEALAEEIGLYETDTALITRRAWPARGMVVDPGIHIMGWTREQAVDFMAESGRSTPDRAKKTVDRIAILPGQLTAYDSGALELFALRAQAEEELGDDFDIRVFHDRLLEHGSIPLPMLRQHIEAWISEESAATRSR